ncbi:MAG TPA: choice-of-anchor tandem repeat NxxGxxAF-containing protein, partial [Candidatus Methylomirabilis sp.]|nr:choice-of-anchor tandem repeat NxxGxxAF-containing protein [Candidatus Methylomirabilis sp.]
TFAGTFVNTSINNRADIVFTGMVPATIGPGASIGLGMGLFQADKKDHITKVVGPGDPAPGGNTFDYATNGWINNRGDIAFGAHVKEDACLDLGQTLPAFIFCAESVYVKDAATGKTKSIAHQGAPAPGGGIYRLAFGPVLNNQGEIAFIGDLTPAPGFGENLAVFLHKRGNTVPVARPGDSLPGGGNLLRASFFVLDYHLNNRGEVAFSGVLDTSSDNVNNDTGLYVFSHGSLRLVARTGTVIPNVGKIARLGSPNFPLPLSGAANNDRGQVFFHATLTDGKTVLLLATPSND